MDTKMTKSIVFFDALSDEAKQKARKWYREGNDMPFLKDSLTELASDLIKKAGYRIQELNVHYSLSYCQGDGVSFDGVLIKNKRKYTLKQGDNHYVHEMTMNASSNKEYDDGEERDEPVFLEKMRKIARLIEKAGYAEIEEENSDEYVDDSIIVNEYTFTLEGERMNPDDEIVKSHEHTACRHCGLCTECDEDILG